MVSAREEAKERLVFSSVRNSDMAGLKELFPTAEELVEHSNTAKNTLIQKFNDKNV